MTKRIRVGSGLLEMGRRAFLGGVAGSAALVAMGARAQQAPPVVALVSGHLPVDVMIEGEDGDPGWAAFLAEMRTQGFVEGETVTYTRTSGIQYMASIRLQGRRLQGLSRNYLEGGDSGVHRFVLGWCWRWHRGRRHTGCNCHG